HQQTLALNARMKQALLPKTELLPPIEELPAEVVQDIFDSVVLDPGQELEERCQVRRAESLALQLEHVLACPSDSLRQALKLGDVCIRIAFVEAPEEGEASDVHTVHFQVPAGQDAGRLERKLNSAALVLSRAVARRLLVALAPPLRFVPEEKGSTGTDALTARSQLWRVAKTARRVRVHRAMQSWATTMNW
ncbi:unnamed protein product, partial [Polarella glacialis]